MSIVKAIKQKKIIKYIEKTTTTKNETKQQQ